MQSIHVEKINIYGPMLIGMTDNIPNIYQLLAVLQLLAAWVNTEFRSQVINGFHPPPQ